MNAFCSRIPFGKTVSVVGLHGLGTKGPGKVKASSRCELVVRTLMLRQIVVRLVQDKLFGLFRIECFHGLSAACEPKLLAMFLHCL